MWCFCLGLDPGDRKALQGQLSGFRGSCNEIEENCSFNDFFDKFCQINDDFDSE